MRVGIVGAGPAGLGAACALERLGADWFLVEAEPVPGGLSRSFLVDGYTWDLGGHVVFSHRAAFDEALDAALPPAEWLSHVRAAKVRVASTWVDYPFQNNIGQLPAAERDECLAGLRARDDTPAGADFLCWMQHRLGAGISRLFMAPYNSKVWAHALTDMSASWIADRVARPDVAELEARIMAGASDREWGPNARFRFPRRGGTGRIWTEVARRLPGERMRFGTAVVGLDRRARRLRLAGGITENYDALISTMPLDRLLEMLEVSWPGAALVHNQVDVVGLGVPGELPGGVPPMTWSYYPEPAYPFYRITVFSRYSPANAPPGTCSLMAEVASPAGARRDPARLVHEVVAGCRQAGLLAGGAEPSHVWFRHLPYGYPVPVLARDGFLPGMLAALAEDGILSRGRFGAWRYEVGNMDHCFVQGSEAAARLVHGTEETMYLGDGR